MGNNWFDKNNWKSALTWQVMFLNSDFPSSNFEYKGSFWENWVDRVQEGQRLEEESLSQLRERLKSESSDAEQAYADYGGDLVGDGHLQLDNLTNSMYAALVVSLWSKMEHFLKNMIAVCCKGLQKKEKALNTVSTFCSESLDKQLDKRKLKNCIDVLKKLQLSPYKFAEIKKFFKKEMKIKLEELADYSTIDAVRILNNSFKHSNGFYKPVLNRTDTKIKQSLLTTWDIVKDKEVDYSKLPIEELVLACGAFNHELITAIKSELEKVKITV